MGEGEPRTIAIKEVEAAQQMIAVDWGTSAAML
jgi:hypothetical protein